MLVLFITTEGTLVVVLLYLIKGLYSIICFEDLLNKEGSHAFVDFHAEKVGFCSSLVNSQTQAFSSAKMFTD